MKTLIKKNIKIFSEKGGQTNLEVNTDYLFNDINNYYLIKSITMDNKK